MKIKLALIALVAAVIIGFVGIILIKNNKELDKQASVAAQHDFLPGIQMKNEILLEANEAQKEYNNASSAESMGKFLRFGESA